MNLEIISHTSRVIAKFMSTWPIFRYHGKSGWSEANLNGTMKLADLDNPHFGTRIWDICCIQAIVVFKHPNLSHFTDSRSPLLGPAPNEFGIRIASEHQCYTLLFQNCKLHSHYGMILQNVEAMTCSKKSPKWGFCPQISVRRHLIKCNGDVCIADESTLCGEVSRKSVQIMTESVWKKPRCKILSRRGRRS